MVLGVAAALAGCGSSSKPRASSSDANAQGIQFADCMRAHGVPNFPDPGSGGSINLSLGSGINPQSPAFQSAQRACAKLQPGAGQPHQMSESQRLAAIAFAKCMRKHGMPDFPDPTESVSSSSPTPTLVLRGMEFQFSAGLNPRSPAFRQAASACGA
jgi:hypothetical protein